MSLLSFWSACERLCTAGLSVEWERAIGEPEILDAARQGLAPIDTPACYYPCTATPWCACTHEVVTHRDETKDAICVCDDSDCGAIPVTDRDLVIYQLDLPRLFGAIGRAVGFERRLVDLADPRMTYHVGNYTYSPGRVLPLFFSMPNSPACFSDGLLQIGFRFGGPLVVLTTSQSQYDLSAAEIAARNGVLLLCLSDLTLLGKDGRICVDSRVRTIIDEFAGKAFHADAPDEIPHPSAQCVIPESVFRHADGFHKVWIHGKRLPMLSDMQADMVRVLYEAALSGEAELRFAAIASRMTEPPGRFDNVFRADDPRREVIRTVKRGVFQLSI